MDDFALTSATRANLQALQATAPNNRAADLNRLLDTTAEGAVQLALETRFQIAAETLAITAKREQQVLRLF